MCWQKKERNTKQEKTNRIDKLNDKIEATKKEIRDLNDKKSLINSIADEKLRALKRGLGVALAVIFIAWIYLIIHVGWNDMEIYTYIVGAFLFVAPIIISFVTDKSFNPNALLIRYRKSVFNDNCRLYNYSDAMLEDSEQALRSLETQLKDEQEE